MELTKMQPRNGTLTADRTTLIDLLARVDAIFSPIRANRATRNSMLVARRELRDLYLAGGIHAPQHGGSAAERKAAERGFDAMEGAGLIVAQRGRGRRTLTKLSALGDYVGRLLAARDTLHDAWRYLERLHAIRNMDWGTPGGVPEPWVAGITTYRGSRSHNYALFRTESCMLPMLSAGYATSNSDCEQHVWFFLTPAGESAAAAGEPEEPDLPEIGPDTVASRLYDQLLSQHQSALEAMQPTRENAVWIPISAGLAWGFPPREEAEPFPPVCAR